MPIETVIEGIFYIPIYIPLIITFVIISQLTTIIYSNAKLFFQYVTNTTLQEGLVLETTSTGVHCSSDCATSTQLASTYWQN